MSQLDACIDGTAKELGLAAKDVREIVESIDRFRKRKRAEGSGRLDDEVRQFAKSEAERVKIAAALKRKQAALNIILRDEWQRDLADLEAAGADVREAVLAKLVGSYLGIGKARQSASARRAGLESDWLGGMSAEINERVPHVAPLMKNPKVAKPLFDDVVREWRQPGSTGNEDAAALKDIFAKYAEASRLEANRAGANIGRLEGWGGPQAHDAGKLMAAGRERWIADIMAGIDIERSFGEGADAAKAMAALDDIYDTIVTGFSNRRSAKERGERVGPANLASSLEKHRVLHFKDADAWIAYADRYSRGNIATAMIDHLHGMARTVSLMQSLGPNPQVFLDGILETQRRAIKEGKLSDAAKVKALASLNADLDKGSGAIGKAFAEISGDTFRPGNITAAKIGSGIRAVESMAKLGGAVISSVTDLATYAARMRFQGRGLLQGYADGLTGLLDRAGAKDRHHIGMLLGVGHETFLGNIHSRFAAEDNIPGKMSRAMNAFFRLSGLTWWTDNLTDTFAAMSSVDMAAKAGTHFAQLDGAYQHVLGLHGIDEKRWDLVQHLMAEQGSYTFVHPERVRELPDEAFHGLVDKPTPRQIEKARRDLELDLRSYFVDEASFAVLRGDDRTRMFVTQGTAPGTALGEAIRFIMQFKSFPVAYIQKVLTPAVRGAGPGQSRDYVGLAALIGMSTVLGYGAMTIKDTLKNRTLRDPTDPATWIAALIQGGGAGIYGDFLFSKRDRLGGGWLGDLSGPTLGTVSNIGGIWQDMFHGSADVGPKKALANAGADSFRLLMNNTPFINLWYTRAALDLSVLNWLQEHISPGTLKRREQTMKREYGQRYIVDPMALTP